jgi:hypothetical protein
MSIIVERLTSIAIVSVIKASVSVLDYIWEVEIVFVLKIVENAGVFNNYPSGFSKHCIWACSSRGYVTISLRLCGRLL